MREFGGCFFFDFRGTYRSLDVDRIRFGLGLCTCCGRNSALYCSYRFSLLPLLVVVLKSM